MLARLKRHIKFATVFTRNLVGCVFLTAVIMAAVSHYVGTPPKELFSWDNMTGGVKTCILLAITFLPYGITLWETDESRNNDE